jgi:multisubunit Na+/H+ antiporter MnhF subunit
MDLKNDYWKFCDDITGLYILFCTSGIIHIHHLDIYQVIALDLLVTTGIGFISAYSILYNQPTLLDVAMILALIAFLGTVAFTYYIQKKNKP